MWTPFDYLIDREFCDSFSVRQALATLARKTNSVRAVLLVRRGERIQRSLAIVFDENAESAQSLENWLFQTANNKLQSFAFLPKLAMQNKFLRLKELLLAESEDSNTLDRLASKLSLNTFVRAVHCRRLCYPNATNNVYQAFVLLFCNNATEINAEDFVEVSLMIACSAPVLVQSQVEELERNRTVIERTTATMKSSLHLPESNLNSDTALDRFCSIVPCHYATLIHQQRLQNNDSWDKPNKPLEYQGEQPHLSIDHENLMKCRSFRFAIQRLRPLLFNRRSQMGRDNAFEFSVGDIEETFNRPIASILIIPFHSTNDLFVLLACRFFTSQLIHSFTSSDLTSGYESVRAAFARHQEEKVRLAFHEMKNVLKAPASYASTESEEKTTYENITATSGGLPLEYHKAAPAIQTLLQSAAKATGSRAARLYFINPKSYELVEVASNIATNEPTTGMAVSLTSNSILAAVARDGITIYNNELPLLSIIDPNDVETHFVRSEICFPIYLSGLLIGVLELKHRMEKAYDGWEHFLELICLAISQQLALARQDVDAQLLAETPDVFELEHLRKHTLSFLAKLKKLHLVPKDAVTQMLFDEEVRSLQEEASSIATRHTLASCTEKLIEIFEHVSQSQNYRIDLRFAKRIRPDLPELTSCKVNKSISKASHSAFVGYYKNLDHTSPEDLLLSYDVFTWGGGRFLKLILESPCNTPLMMPCHEFNQLVYRQPFRTGYKIHYGCYIMGRVMREAGGDIIGEVEYQDSGFKFTTTFFFPLSE